MELTIVHFAEDILGLPSVELGFWRLGVNDDSVGVTFPEHGVGLLQQHVEAFFGLAELVGIVLGGHLQLAMLSTDYVDDDSEHDAHSQAGNCQQPGCYDRVRLHEFSGGVCSYPEHLAKVRHRS